MVEPGTEGQQHSDPGRRDVEFGFPDTVADQDQSASFGEAVSRSSYFRSLLLEPAAGGLQVPRICVQIECALRQFSRRSPRWLGFCSCVARRPGPKPPGDHPSA